MIILSLEDKPYENIDRLLATVILKYQSSKIYKEF
jgi:hypothetical protein